MKPKSYIANPLEVAGMIIKTNVTVFQCEHCKKKLFVRQAMERHIKWCTSNPDNFKACSGCKHLEETVVEYERDTHSTEWGHDTETKRAKGFRCTHLDKLLYPLIVEKKGLVDKYPETFEGQEPMPKECAHFETDLPF